MKITWTVEWEETNVRRKTEPVWDKCSAVFDDKIKAFTKYSQIDKTFGKHIIRNLKLFKNTKDEIDTATFEDDIRKDIEKKIATPADSFYIETEEDTKRRLEGEKDDDMFDKFAPIIS